MKPPNITASGKIPLTEIPASSLCHRWETKPPSASQLAYADKFFERAPGSPRQTWVTGELRNIPLDSPYPEVAFLGRSNAGKSSLINALVNKTICFKSSTAASTRRMTGYGVGASHASSPPKVVLVDMPGYGYKALSKWAEEMMKYLKARKQFRRAFLLVDADVGPKATDRAMLDFCRHYAVPHQVVLARADKALSSSSNKIRTGVVPKNLSLLDHKMRNLKPVVQPPRAVDGSGTPGDAPGALGEILATSAKNELGLDNLRWAILTAAGYGGSVEVKSDAASAAPSSLSSGKTVSADL